VEVAHRGRFGVLGGSGLCTVIGSYELPARRWGSARSSRGLIPNARAVVSAKLSLGLRSKPEAASRHHVHVEPEEDSLRAGASGRRTREIVSSGRRVAVLCCQVEAAAVLRVPNSPNVVGVKDSSGSQEILQALTAERPEARRTEGIGPAIGHPYPGSESGVRP
jgi:hypothetical protein